MKVKNEREMIFFSLFQRSARPSVKTVVAVKMESANALQAGKETVVKIVSNISFKSCRTPVFQ